MCVVLALSKRTWLTCRYPALCAPNTFRVFTAPEKQTVTFIEYLMRVEKLSDEILDSFKSDEFKLIVVHVQDGSG